MKKQYINPEIEVCSINNVLMFCTSPALNTDPSDPGEWNLGKSFNSDDDMFDDEEEF